MRVGQFAALGFSIEIEADDVETILLLMQSHSPSTFQHAASLLAGYISRGTSLFCLAVWVCLGRSVLMVFVSVLHCDRYLAHAHDATVGRH